MAQPEGSLRQRVSTRAKPKRKSQLGYALGLIVLLVFSATTSAP